jgi:FkbM family methyltransferase
MNFPFKDLTFSGDRFRIHGLSADDPYFQMLHDNMEPEFTLFCRRYIRPDYVCLDVGANIGVKSLILAAHAPHGKVVAIEPGPSIGKLLELNVRTNQAANIAIERVAVGSQTGTTVRFVENSAFGFVGERGDAGDCVADVPMTTLSVFVEKLGLPRIDFIKIDVEGLEFPILESSLELINRNDALVYFEFNAWAQMVHTDVRPREFAQWLLRSFSHVYLVSHFGEFADLLSPVGKDDWLGILQHNCFTADFVDDIVVTNAPWRLDAAEAARSTDVLQHNDALPRRKELVAERELLRAELAALRTERDSARAQLDVLRNSTSWRVTSGLRAIGRVLKSR